VDNWVCFSVVVAFQSASSRRRTHHLQQGIGRVKGRYAQRCETSNIGESQCDQNTFLLHMPFDARGRSRENEKSKIKNCKIANSQIRKFLILQKKIEKLA
jgi:hypothetical protein